MSQQSSEFLEINTPKSKRRPIMVATILGIGLGLALIAALTWFSRSQTTVTAPTAATVKTDTPSAAPEADPIAAALLALRAGKLFAPAGDNAFESYLSARETQPDSVAIQHALLEMTPMVMQGAELALSRNEIAESERLMQLLERADPKSNNVLLLKERIAAQATARQQEDARAEAQAAARAATAAQPAPVPPPAAVSTPTGSTPIAPTAPPARSEVAVAPTPTPTPTPAAPTPSVATRRPPAEPIATPPAPERTETVAAAAPPKAALKLIGAIRPTYPRNALQRRIEGHVDLRFQVSTDGSVSDVTVVAASPANIFEREAISAMQRARFAPIPTAQQATRRIEFRQQ